MATRRPPVPKAQFTSGIGGSSEKGAHPAPTPDVDADAARVSSGSGVGGSVGGGRKKGDKPRGREPRERRATSKPTGRSTAEGVIHPAGNSPVPARSFSGRLLVLGLAMGVVTLLLAPNVHTYLQQRAEISALRDDIAAQEVQQDVNEAELNRWDDPAYIKQQARDRVSMLMPGETGYWVYGANGVVGLDDTAKAAKTAAAQGTTAKNATEITVEPWVAGLWDAVQKSSEIHSETPKQAPAKTPAPAPEPAPEPAPAG